MKRVNLIDNPRTENKADLRLFPFATPVKSWKGKRVGKRGTLKTGRDGSRGVRLVRAPICAASCVFSLFSRLCSRRFSCTLTQTFPSSTEHARICGLRGGWFLLTVPAQSRAKGELSGEQEKWTNSQGAEGGGEKGGDAQKRRGPRHHGRGHDVRRIQLQRQYTSSAIRLSFHLE